MNADTLNTLTGIGAIASPVVGALGSGLSFLSGLSAQDKSLAAMREANAFNERMYERQKQDSIDFWNLQNKYNSPSAEVARLRAAGLNPALTFGDAQGAAQLGVPSASAAQSAQFQPAFTPAASDVMLKGIQDSISSSVAAVQAKDQHDSMMLDNQLKSATLQVQIAKAIQEYHNLVKQGNLSDAEKAYRDKMIEQLNREMKFFDATYNERVDAVHLGNQLTQETIDNLYSQTSLNLANKQMAALQPWLQTQANSREWLQVRGVLAEIDGRIALMKKEGNLTDANIRKVVQETLGQKIGNRKNLNEVKHLQGLYPLITRQLQLDVEKGEFDKKFWANDKAFGIWKDFNQTLSMGLGAAAMFKR